MKGPSLLQAQEAARRAGCVISHRGSIPYWLARAAEAQASATKENDMRGFNQYNVSVGVPQHPAECDDEPFTLTNPKPKPQTWRPPKEEPRRQAVLFCGLEDSPGQLDIFPTDGTDQGDDDGTVHH